MVRLAHHEGRTIRSGRPLRRGPRAAAGAAHRQAPVLLDARLHRRDIDLLVHADHLGRQIGRQRQAAAGAAGRAVIDDGVGIGRERALVALVARPSTSPESHNQDGIMTLLGQTLTISSVRRWFCMDHPTILRLNTSSTTARYRNPLIVGT